MAANAVPISTVTATREGAIAVVRVVGEIDMSSVEPLDRTMRQELAARPRGLVLDLLDVGFWGSSGIRTLVEARTRAESARIELRLVATSPVVLRPLELCGLFPLFRVHETVPDAVHDLAA
jgi:anti-sigma B factor antagonist